MQDYQGNKYRENKYYYFPTQTKKIAFELDEIFEVVRVGSQEWYWKIIFLAIITEDDNLESMVKSYLQDLIGSSFTKNDMFKFFTNIMRESVLSFSVPREFTPNELWDAVRNLLKEVYYIDMKKLGIKRDSRKFGI